MTSASYPEDRMAVNMRGIGGCTIRPQITSSFRRCLWEPPAVNLHLPASQQESGISPHPTSQPAVSSAGVVAMLDDDVSRGALGYWAQLAKRARLRRGGMFRGVG